jgi:hypothetical protein
MFLAATDLCAHCKGAIYPDDEKIESDMDWYHIECAENAELDLDEEE